MSVIQMTAEEFIDSLTGFDEIAIEKHMGFDFYEAAEAGKNVKLLRAAVFVASTRLGKSPVEAIDVAQSMPAKTLNEYFLEPADDVDPENPDSESGKDEPAPA